MGSNPGKDTPAQVSENLDLLSPSDRRMILSAQKRWGLGKELKEKCIEALEWGIDYTMAEADERGVRGFLQIAATFEGQNQTDEHLKDKYERIDKGEGTECVVYDVKMPAPRKDSTD